MDTTGLAISANDVKPKWIPEKMVKSCNQCGNMLHTQQCNCPVCGYEDD